MMESLAEVRGLQEDNMDLMRKAAGGSAQNVKMKDGKLKMDAFTASAIMKVYDKVNPANKKKIETIINSGKKNQMMKLQSMAMKAIKSDYDAELDEAVKRGTLKDLENLEKSLRDAKKKKDKKKAKMDPFIVGIATIVALSAIVTTLVDYQFKMIAATSFPDEKDLVSFFGTFYSIAGASSIIMQFFITGPVLSRFGILLGLLILPFFLIAGSVTLLFVPVLMSASFAKYADQTFKFTINNSSMELLWLPVPPDIRKTIKPQVLSLIHI